MPCIYWSDATVDFDDVSILFEGGSGGELPSVDILEASLLLTYINTPPTNDKFRAWTFTLDGHTYYVLTLGDEGTFVYDITNKTWYQWATEGYNTWNMEQGISRVGKTLAHDQITSDIWELDPNSFLDNGYKSQRRRLTAGIFARNRTFLANYALRVTGSFGSSQVPISLPVALGSVSLSYSDDQGRSFHDAGSIDIIDGDFEQELSWLSLGTVKPPFRVFTIEDVGGLIRIDGVDVDVGEEGK